MSSDGSSGITQFGLYRTIDARTEEFLRLSRKRQIRQGCACAAVSTAITVTVVVSVLLVYEYSLISGNSKSNSYVMKPNWLGFINASADTTPFNATYSKAKLNLDKTTIKLLPTLLNSLKQNIFLENVIEDFTSASPTDKPDDTTEQNYKKNIFSEPRYLFKAPTSRVYTIEFKGSPIVYYQRTRNLEYITKIRKIRDYKRILDYFEKMINDKVTVGSTLPMVKREFLTGNPSQLSTTIPIRKIHTSKQKPRLENFNKIVKRPPVIETKNCKCPIKLGELLNKLIGNINQLLPYSKMTESTLCEKRNSTKSAKIPAKTVKKNYANPKFTTSKSVNVISIPNSMQKMKIITENESSFSMNIIKNDSRVNRINEKQTTIRNYIEATESKSIKLPTTKPMITAIDKFTHSLYKNLQKFTHFKTTVAANKVRHKPDLNNEEYDDYFINTPTTGPYNDILDIHNLELIKTRINPPKHNAKNFKYKNNVDTKNAMKSLTNTTSTSLVPVQSYKNKDFSFENKTDSIFLQKLTNLKQEIKTQNEKIMEPGLENPAEVYQFDHIHNDDQFGYEDKIINDDIFQEYKIKQSSKTIKVRPDILKYDKVKQDAENNENLPRNVNSMLPQPRPVYLEIQRNNWKQDDAHDYDFNVNNNLYDYPNI